MCLALLCEKEISGGKETTHIQKKDQGKDIGRQFRVVSHRPVSMRQQVKRANWLSLQIKSPTTSTICAFFTCTSTHTHYIHTYIYTHTASFPSLPLPRPFPLRLSSSYHIPPFTHIILLYTSPRVFPHHHTCQITAQKIKSSLRRSSSLRIYS